MNVFKFTSVLLLLVASAALAQDGVPTDAARTPLKLVVPFAAGGPTDVVARIIGELFSKRNGNRPVVVENRPGAGTIVATAAGVNAPRDSSTYLLATNSLYINPAIGPKLSYDTPAARARSSMTAPQRSGVAATNPAPAGTPAALRAPARRSPEPLTYPSPGPRGVGHLAGEMLKQRAGIAMIHINYNGSAPALTDV